MPRLGAPAEKPTRPVVGTGRPTPYRYTLARRARSSVGQSRRLIIAWPQVQVLPGPRERLRRSLRERQRHWLRCLRFLVGTRCRRCVRVLFVLELATCVGCCFDLASGVECWCGWMLIVWFETLGSSPAGPTNALAEFPMSRDMSFLCPETAHCRAHGNRAKLGSLRESGGFSGQPRSRSSGVTSPLRAT